MRKKSIDSERLWRALVDVERVENTFNELNKLLKASDIKKFPSQLRKKMNLRKLFKLPSPWYVILTEGNLLEWAFPLDLVERVIGTLRGKESLRKFKKKCEDELFLLSYEDKKPSISVYNLWRDMLLKDCEKLGYDESRIKQIAKFDDFIAKLMIEESQPNLNGGPLVFLKKWLEYVDKMSLEFIKEKRLTKEEIEKARTEVNTPVPKGKINLPEYIKSLASKGIPPQERLFVKRLATLLRLKHEMGKLSLVHLFHQKLKEGYSPQVWFAGNNIESYIKFVKGTATPDWRISLDNIEQFHWLTFFRTPEFEVTIENGKIIVTILDPENVTTVTEWKRIRSVYSRFRKVLGVKRKPWGTETGRREYQKRINLFVKETARVIKSQNPTLGLYNILDLTKEELFKEFKKSYSVDTLRRKLYTRE